MQIPLFLVQFVALIVWFTVPAMAHVPLWLILLPSIPLILIFGFIAAMFVGTGLFMLIGFVVDVFQRRRTAKMMAKRKFYSYR